MSKTMIENIVGAGVLLVAAGFTIFATQEGGVAPSDGYEVKARFSSAVGVSPGSDIRIGGIKVGVISAMELDPKSYEAVVSLNLNEDVLVPEDSSAAIVSAGLLGNKFIEITPGGMDDMLKDGGEIEFTQSSVNIESLIGKFVHSGGGVDDEGGESAASEPAPEDDLGYGVLGGAENDAGKSAVPSLE